MRGHLVPFVTSMAESVDTYKGRYMADGGEEERGEGRDVLMSCMAVVV